MTQKTEQNHNPRRFWEVQGDENRVRGDFVTRYVEARDENEAIHQVLQDRSFRSEVVLHTVEARELDLEDEHDAERAVEAGLLTSSEAHPDWCSTCLGWFRDGDTWEIVVLDAADEDDAVILASRKLRRDKSECVRIDFLEDVNPGDLAGMVFKQKKVTP